MISISWKEETNMRCISHSGVSMNAFTWMTVFRDWYDFICEHMCIIYTSGVIVCVEHLKRCKTSNRFVIFWFLDFAQQTYFQQGDHPCTVCDGPTKRPQYMRISRLITVTYLLHFSLSVFRNGDRPSQEPACRFDLHFIFFMPALLSQSGIFYGQ